jgi:hypothetical protein
MATVMQETIKAVELKTDVQRKLARKLKGMPSSMSYADKIRKIARSGRLGSWWKSLPHNSQ